MATVGETLISLLEAHGVDMVFGIPGVHTIELYRGLARSRIRHVTPRHEQGAGFMADGYARISGRPGVAFVITGPGLTNTITAMAQARADSVPMLVISGVNALPALGKGLGFLHELPDQRGMMEKVALFSHRVEDPAELPDVLHRAFTLFATARPGPVHVEIPLDVMGRHCPPLTARPIDDAAPAPDEALLDEVVKQAGKASHPLILAGGGARRSNAELLRVAEKLDAPVVTTANARGLLHDHPLAVHASPSLFAVRELMGGADFVLAAGTEFGPTDYDMYANGGFVLPENLARIDIDASQLDRRPSALSIRADCAVALDMLAGKLPPSTHRDGAARAAAARAAAFAEIGEEMRGQVVAVEMIRNTLPEAVIVGDSTQPVYAANLYYDHDRPGGWFNAATGYGALGFGPPAAIGAALADPQATVVCLSGDGGFQFTLPELGAALDAGARVIFVVWNNHGYREIETSMREAGVEPVGVSPAPPDFIGIAAAYRMPAERLTKLDGFPAALRHAHSTGKAALIEILVS